MIMDAPATFAPSTTWNTYKKHQDKNKVNHLCNMVKKDI